MYARTVTMSAVVAFTAASCGRVATPPSTTNDDAGIDVDASLRTDARQSTFEPTAVEDASSAPPLCETYALSPIARPAALELVADGALSSELAETIDALASNADPDLSVGLIVFADTLDPNEAVEAGAASYPTSIDVPLGPVNASQAAALRARLGGSVGPHVFLGRALAGAYQTLRAHPAASNAVALITTRTSAQESALADATNALAPDAGSSVMTAVLGAGPFLGADPTVYDVNFLAQLSVAGGTAVPGCDATSPVSMSVACFSPVPPSPPAGLTIRELVREISTRLRGGCEFSTPSPLGDPFKVNVLFQTPDDRKHIIAYDPSDGWTYDDESHPSRIMVSGQACLDITADVATTVQAVVNCQNEVP